VNVPGTFEPGGKLENVIVPVGPLSDVQLPVMPALPTVNTARTLSVTVTPDATNDQVPVQLPATSADADVEGAGVVGEDPPQLAEKMSARRATHRNRRLRT